MIRKDLEVGLRELTDKILPALIQKGMRRAGLNFARDVLMDAPKVPFDKGTLQGTVAVHLNNRLIADGSTLGVEVSTPADTPGDEVKPGTDVVTVSFNTEYAARLHEHPEFEFNEAPARGGKYLERKLYENADSYLAEVADTINQGLT